MSEPLAQPTIEEAQPEAVKQGFIRNAWDRVRQNRVAKGVTAVAAVGAIAFVGWAAGSGKVEAPFGGSANGEENDSPDIENCSDSVLSNDAFEYKGTFLPPAENEVGDSDSAAEYTQSWFDENGPLAQRISPAAQGAVFAAIGGPATEGNSINNSITIPERYDQSMKKLKNKETALAEAERLCGINYDVIAGTVKYDANAIAEGQQFTTLTPVYGKNSIVNLKLEKHTAQRTIEGTTFQIQNSDGATGDKMNGFDKVIAEDDGTLSILGVVKTKDSGKEKDDDNKGKGGNNKNKNKDGKGGAKDQQDDSQGADGTYSQTNDSTGESNQPGNVPESGGNGGYTPDTPPSNGPGGGTPPSTGGGTPPSTGGGTPPSTGGGTPPVTPNNPPVTPVVPTTPGKGSEPGCVPSEYTPC